MNVALSMWRSELQNGIQQTCRILRHLGFKEDKKAEQAWPWENGAKTKRESEMTKFSELHWQEQVKTWLLHKTWTFKKK